jgi:cystathionine beta-lyase/cystathionine gamma-synthase
MGPTRESVGAALAKYLEGRAVVQQVYGPYTTENGEREYRVKMNNGAIISFRVWTYQEAIK